MFKNLFTFLLFSVFCVFNSIFTYQVDTKDSYQELLNLSILTPKFEKIIENNDSKLIIELNDGSQWIVIGEFNNLSDNQYLNASINSFNNWQTQDEIIINENIFCKDNKSGHANKISKYILKNANFDQVFYVELNKEALDCVKTNTIIMIDKNGYFIKTSNNIDWEINWLEAWTSYKWMVGDRIIIARADKILQERDDKIFTCKTNPYGKSDDFILINIDTKDSVNPKLIQWK